MRRHGWRLAIYGALAALYLLHNDLWLWNEPRRIAGLPAGLFYHLAYCVVTAAVLALLVSLAWPPWGRGDDDPPATAPGPGERR
jgi:Protein of unknown function (DUF3311)